MDRYNIETENLSELLDGLNNAIISYKDVISSIQFGCNVPAKLEVLRNISEEKLLGRYNSLTSVYKQLLEYEKD